MTYLEGGRRERRYLIQCNVQTRHVYKDCSSAFNPFFHHVYIHDAGHLNICTLRQLFISHHPHPPSTQYTNSLHLLLSFLCSIILEKSMNRRLLFLYLFYNCCVPLSFFKNTIVTTTTMTTTTTLGVCLFPLICIT